jgi:hypothetical protein
MYAGDARDLAGALVGGAAQAARGVLPQLAADDPWRVATRANCI